MHEPRGAGRAIDRRVQGQLHQRQANEAMKQFPTLAPDPELRSRAGWAGDPGGWIASAAVITLILAFGGVQARWHLPVYGALYATTLIYLMLGASGRIQLTWNSIFLPGIALICLPLMQLALHTTVNGAASATGFMHLLAAACAFSLAWWAGKNPHFREQWLRFAAIAGGLLALEAIMQFYLFRSRIFGIFPISSNQPIGSFVNHDDFAASMELLFPTALILMARAGQTLTQKISWGCLAAIIFASVILSASRGGAIGVAVELLLFWLWRRKTKPFAPAPGKQKTGPKAGIGRATEKSWPILLVLILLFAGVTGYQRLIRRMPGTNPELHSRLSLDAVSWQMGRQKPLLGWGVGSWAFVYPQFARWDDGLILLYAHCDYAQWWAETGMAGLVLAIGFATIFLWKLKLQPRDELTWAGLFALAAVCLHASFDFIWHIPALWLLTAIWMGLTMRNTGHRMPYSEKQNSGNNMIG